MNTLAFLQSENARLQRENRELKTQLQRLYAVVRTLSLLLDTLEHLTPDYDTHTLLAQVLDTALDAVNTDHGSLLLLDEDTGELVFVLVRGPFSERLTGVRLAPGEGIAGWALRYGEPVLVPDVRFDPRWTTRIDEYTQWQTHTVLAVPLISKGRKLGVLEALNPRHGMPFTEEDQGILMLVGQLAALVLDQADRLSSESQEEGETRDTAPCEEHATPAAESGQGSDDAGAQSEAAALDQG